MKITQMMMKKDYLTPLTNKKFIRPLKSYLIDSLTATSANTLGAGDILLPDADNPDNTGNAVIQDVKTCNKYNKKNKKQTKKRNLNQ